MSSINDLPGAIRSGRGILAGLLRCGYCGRKITIFYNAKKSSYPSYSCTGNNNARKRSCFGFGGRKVEKRFSQEILKVLSPLGINASLIAIDELKSGDNEKRKALERQYEQIEYEAKRAFEQYNAVDARNRLVAEELEHRWNEKLEHLKKVKLSLATLEQQNTLSEEERQRILQLGENFQQVWESEYCSVETKKKIIRILVETVIIKLNDSGDKLHIVIHWKGGTHTQFDMERPLDATKQKTSLEAIEIIRKMGSRYGYSDIAQALNKAGHQTGKGNSWTEARVEAMRYKYSIPGQTKTKPNADILTLNQAAKYCNVSKTTIKNLVSKGVLKNKQSSPYAPWEINRFDLDSDLVRTIIARLRKTGKLIIQGDDLSVDQLLFE